MLMVTDEGSIPVLSATYLVRMVHTANSIRLKNGVSILVISFYLCLNRKKVLQVIMYSNLTCCKKIVQ